MDVREWTRMGERGGTAPFTCHSGLSLHGDATFLNPVLQPWIFGKMQLMPLHPHNAPLQLWLELGIPGALLFVAITACLLIAIARRLRDRLAAATAATVLLVAITLSSFSYGIWQTWWLAALWLAAGLTAMVTRPVEPQKN